MQWQTFPEPSAFARAPGGSGVALTHPIRHKSFGKVVEVTIWGLILVCLLQNGLHLRISAQQLLLQVCISP